MPMGDSCTWSSINIATTRCGRAWKWPIPSTDQWSHSIIQASSTVRCGSLRKPLSEPIAWIRRQWESRPTGFLRSIIRCCNMRRQQPLCRPRRFASLRQEPAHPKPRLIPQRPWLRRWKHSGRNCNPFKNNSTARPPGQIAQSEKPHRSKNEG
jgi:hypothetical protein